MAQLGWAYGGEVTADPDAAQVVEHETIASHLEEGQVQPMRRSCRPWASQSEHWRQLWAISGQSEVGTRLKGGKKGAVQGRLIRGSNVQGWLMGPRLCD